MTSSEFDGSITAAKAMYLEHGDGFCFPPDLIWKFFNGALPVSGMRPGLIRNLQREGYVVKTGRTTRSASVARKGNPVSEYTFGPRISGNSLQLAIGSTGAGDLPLTDLDDAELLDDLRYRDAEPNPDGVFPLEFPLQRILHGCPGSGKSFVLKRDAAKAHFVVRSVFHPETRYSDFVGGLRPESIYRISDEEIQFVGSESKVPGEPYVQYVVRPGALLKSYHLACMHPACSVVLIIEELSRAPASQVFGDMLQLLDRRDTEGEALSGFSEYEIEPQPDIRAWLRMNQVDHENVSPSNMRFPPNLYFWATMNRSDQNARQLDSAFLRRWSKKYLSYRETGAYDDTEVLYGGVPVRWSQLRRAINERLKSSEGVPEDKFVGPYFISQRGLGNPEVIYEDLWGYIWNDVLKSRAPHFFNGAATFADLQESWANGKGQPIGLLETPSDVASS